MESLHVALSRGETRQNFNIWVYGEGEKLSRGSGLFVDETGVTANHHFLTPSDASSFHFNEGHYRLDVFARLPGHSKAKVLFSQELAVSRETAVALEERGTGVYFEWGPDSARYSPNIRKRPPAADFINAGLRPQESPATG